MACIHGSEQYHEHHKGPGVLCFYAAITGILWMTQTIQEDKSIRTAQETAYAS